ncbi:MAG TPA: hypothetical protein VL201_02310 [Patescibacteria group bacterium]|jgi:uncharacterized protein (DUF1919 family)|nr:hypothetical protein [Patescibacteria group bacterium]
MYKACFFGLFFFISNIAYTMDQQLTHDESISDMANELNIPKKKLSIMLERIHKNLDEMLEESREKLEEHRRNLSDYENTKDLFNEN